MILFLQSGSFSIYTITSFCASIVWGTTGFGYALIFLTVYQLVEFTGIMDRSTFKYAIFLQSIGLTAISSFAIIHKMRELKTFKFCWMFLVPTVGLSFPLGIFGTWLKKYAPTSTIRIICGMAILFSIMVKLYKMFGPFDLRKKPNVYFIIGSQRSGSSWLRCILDTQKDFSAPQPPHILKAYYPIMDKFGDLRIDKNFRYLIANICEYIEATPIKWTDKNNKAINFNQDEIFNKCKHNRSLLQIFEVVMDTQAEMNGKKTWVCKSMSYSNYYKELKQHFGDRLRFIYLYRDPRDVCLSFKNSPLGHNHFFKIAEEWSKLQKSCMSIVENDSAIIETVQYENLVLSFDKSIEKLLNFMNCEANFKMINAVSKMEMTIKTAKASSWQWKNVCNNDEDFRKNQFQKWKKALANNSITNTDIYHIEIGCEHQLTHLGYCLHSKYLSKPTEKEKILIEQENKQTKTSTETEDLRKITDAYGAVLAKIDDYPIKKEKNFISVKALITYILACCFSGILGGLVGARGPPLIIYFLFFPADKELIRVVGVVGSFTSALSRMIAFCVTSPPVDSSWPTTKYLNRNTTDQVFQFDMNSWFIKNDLYLYVSVIIASVLGCILGIYLHERVNQKVFNLILGSVLLFSSIIMIAKGVLEIF